MDKTVADRIKERREELGITQEELAGIIGFKSKSSICKIESAGRKVSLKTIYKMANALDCSAPYLMGCEDASSQSKFQQRLHNLRVEQKYSLESLANELNKRFDTSFTKGMLSKYEAGKTIPDFKNMPFLAEIFGVSVDYLIGASDNPARHENENLIAGYTQDEIDEAMLFYRRLKSSHPHIQEVIEILLRSRQSDS